MTDVFGLFRCIPEKDIGLGEIILLIARRVAVMRRHGELVE